MNLPDLIRSGHLLWGIFFLIAVVFLLTSVSRYRRSGARADLPRALTDAMATGMVVGAALHLGMGVPHPTPLLVAYGAALAGLFLYRLRVVNQLQAEMLARQEALAETNRVRKAAEPGDDPDPSGASTPDP